MALGLGSYAVPIWLLVFLFSFIPLVGAIAAGAIAVLIVLVLNGWIGALIMLAIVLAVQQLEGNVLQPFLMGKAVELHPLAVFLGVAAGAVLAGIPGALFAIPLIAFVNATLLYIVGRDPAPDLGEDRASHEFFAALGQETPAIADRTAGSSSLDRTPLSRLAALRPSAQRSAAPTAGSSAAPTAPADDRSPAAPEADAPAGEQARRDED